MQLEPLADSMSQSPTLTIQPREALRYAPREFFRVSNLAHTELSPMAVGQGELLYRRIPSALLQARI